MENELINSLTEIFEGHAQTTESGVEFWLARDLQFLLGYAKWENFLNVIVKAKTACEVSRHEVRDHFADVGKMVVLGSGSKREIQDIMLTRYACYLIAQNGDPVKKEIAFAQTYFALQTRKVELIEKRLLEAERVSARKKLSSSEKELSGLIFEQTGGNQNFALIRSKGDLALFGKTTQAMKARWKVPDSRPLADFAPTIILKAKDFATEITIHNTRKHEMRRESEISLEHITNNQAVRSTLLYRRLNALYPDASVDELNRHALIWCKDEYGRRKHGTTGIPPLIAFEQIEQSCLKPLPADPFVPARWLTAKVHPDQFIQAKGTYYGLSARYIGIHSTRQTK